MKQFDLQGNEYDCRIETWPEEVKGVTYHFSKDGLLEDWREEALRHREEIEHLNKIIEDFDLFIDGLANNWKITGQELYDKWNEIKSQNIKERTIVNKNTMLSVNGKNFHCTCGANVFTQYSDDTFECHGCGNTFEGR